ncbi:putative transcriptional regulator YheO [Anaerosolibacter carboniphilus]|uniref:Putative transcriptional regulator YheO n=1 Tax=Anaerosolibacter carboniphilus TaxID=1417629 RepID=A0A841KN46_9FIRM|nr:PAS domain-containing protein [Anaerosolibacter carboniphilus]MBB6214867.1 putative transcriptional regulator YheO [Anaerosolibacter carboniphilus]
MNANIHPILKSIIPIVEGIAKTFGKNCEVVLHDFNNFQSSIIAIENGHVTGRSLGSPMTEVGLQAIRKGNTNDSILNYTGKSTDGRALKSSTMFINDESGQVIGCLCINFDMSELIVAQNAIQEITQTESKEDLKQSDNLSNSVNDVLSSIVSNTLEELGKPVAYMSKDEKVNIVKRLDEQGAFLIKGAIDYVAKVLCVSRYTIYNYLDEIRVNK